MMKVLKLAFAGLSLLAIPSPMFEVPHSSGQEAQPPQKFKPPSEAYLKRMEEKSNREKEAVERAKEKVLNNPESAQAHFDFAEAYSADPRRFAANQYGIIADEYKKALELRPDYPEAYQGLARVYGWMNDSEKQFAALNKAITLKPEDAETYCDLGFAYLNDFAKKSGPNTDYRQERELAIEAFRQAVHFKADFARAYEGMGIALHSLRREEEAIEAYRQAIGFEPNNCDFHMGLGRAYIETGDKEGAMREYETLIRIGEAADEDYFMKKKCQVYAEAMLDSIKRKFETK